MGCGASSAAADDQPSSNNRNSQKNQRSPSGDTTNTSTDPSTRKDEDEVGVDEDDDHEYSSPPERGRSKSIAVLNQIADRRAEEENEPESSDDDDGGKGLKGFATFAFGEPRSPTENGMPGEKSPLSGSKPFSTSISEQTSMSAGPGVGGGSPESPPQEKSISFAPDQQQQQQQQQASHSASGDTPEDGHSQQHHRMKRYSRRKSSMAPQLGTRQRRLSSVLNEIGGQIDAFFAATGKKPDTASLDSSAGHDGEAENGTGDGGQPQNEGEQQQQRSPGSCSSSSGHHTQAEENAENLRRLYDEMDPTGVGLEKDSFCEGFIHLGYKEEARAQLERMFDIATKQHAGVMTLTIFKTFFRHLPELQNDLAEEDDEETPELNKSYRMRTQSMWQCPVKFKNYAQRAKASVASRVKVLGVAPHRELFAACDRHDNAIHLFDLRSGKLRKSLVGHQNGILGVAFCPDRKYAMTVSRDCTAIVWDATVGTEQGRIVHPGIVTACAFSFDGKYFLTGCQDNTVRRFATHKRRLEWAMAPLPNSELGVIVALGTQHNANDRVVISRSNDKSAIVLDFTTLEPVLVLEGHEGLVWQAHYSHDDQYIATNCEKEVRIWDAHTGDSLHRYSSVEPTSEPLLGHSRRSKLWTTIQFAPPQFGNVLVACNTDTNIFLFDAATGKFLLNLVFRYAIFALAAGVDTPVILCGDEAGNIGELELL